jgi:hypothetical protein
MIDDADGDGHVKTSTARQQKFWENLWSGNELITHVHTISFVELRQGSGSVGRSYYADCNANQ